MDKNNEDKHQKNYNDCFKKARQDLLRQGYREVNGTFMAQCSGCHMCEVPYGTKKCSKCNIEELSKYQTLYKHDSLPSSKPHKK